MCEEMRNGLAGARKEIEDIDRKIAELFEARMRAAKSVAEYKKQRGLPVEDKAREEELISQNSCLVREDLREYYAIFERDVMKVSSLYQHRLMEGTAVAYCGEEGAFAYFAAKRMIPDGKTVSKSSFEEAYSAVERGECELAVLPLENSYAGEVGQVTDLLFAGPLSINAVCDLSVDQTLLGVPGARISDIKTVISHPQALAQCAKYIKEHGWVSQEDHSTSSAAKRVAGLGDPEVAAIACEETAELYGLSILEKRISESRSNTTRFGVFSRCDNPGAGMRSSDGFSLVFTVKNEAGALAEALRIVGDAGFNMRTLRSRPRKELAWNYYFYMEAEGAVRGAQGKKMLEQLKNCCDKLKVVGVYRQ